MKALASLLLLASVGLAQEPSKGKIITFSQTDKEHCKVVLIDGKPMLQTSYDGTSVTVALPEKNSHGFSVFVRIAREGKGKVEVAPEKVTAIYSDPDHTRFEFVDLTREWEKSHKDELISQGPRPSSSGVAAASSQGDSQQPAGPPPTVVKSTMPNGSTWNPSPARRPDGEARWDSEGGGPRLPRTSSSNSSPFLRRTVVHQLNEVEGIVCLQKPKASNLEVSATGTLSEIDIPIGDVIFRF